MYLERHPSADPRSAAVPTGLAPGPSVPGPITPLAGPSDLSRTAPTPEVPGPFGQYTLGVPVVSGLPARPPSAGGGPPAPT